MTLNFDAIRQGLAELPRADNIAPGATVNRDDIITPGRHRGVMDFERVLVVGNRGMGKSLWAHALLQREVRDVIAGTYGEPSLRQTEVQIGYNASELKSGIAPTQDVVSEALRQRAEPDTIWKAVLARAICPLLDVSLPEQLFAVAEWVKSSAERLGKILAEADSKLQTQGRRLLLVFDALDRLGPGWRETQLLARGLLRVALAMKSTRAIRFKLFMRPDQLDDPSLFDFPDASKVKNDRVELSWTSNDLYELLFHRLSRSAVGGAEFTRLRQTVGSGQKSVIDSLAGEFMGGGKNRGRVFTWIPLHLADAHGQTSPRTFLTVWREAAHHGALPQERAVEHHGITEGVRKASEDRLSELREDYPWIPAVLEPLRGQSVPAEAAAVKDIWRESGTVGKLFEKAKANWRDAPVQLLATGQDTQEEALISALRSIGVLERRPNGKLNVPDIFRVEAGIKRKGGVQPPKRDT